MVCEGKETRRDCVRGVMQGIGESNLLEGES